MWKLTLSDKWWLFNNNTANAFVSLQSTGNSIFQYCWLIFTDFSEVFHIKISLLASNSGWLAVGNVRQKRSAEMASIKISIDLVSNSICLFCRTTGDLYTQSLGCFYFVLLSVSKTCMFLLNAQQLKLSQTCLDAVFSKCQARGLKSRKCSSSKSICSLKSIYCTSQLRTPGLQANNYLFSPLAFNTWTPWYI